LRDEPGAGLRGERTHLQLRGKYGLLNRFSHVENAEKGSTAPDRIIFPSFHQ
jgi:hypothetical protein